MSDLNVLHKGIIRTLFSLQDSALWGSIIGSIFYFIKKFLFDDFEYLQWLAIAIAIDLVLALYYHWKNGTLESKGVDKFTTKIIAYSSALILVHILESFTVNGTRVVPFDWTSSIAYSTILIRETTSIAEKIEMLRPGTLPTFIIRALKLKKSE